MSKIIGILSVFFLLLVGCRDKETVSPQMGIPLPYGFEKIVYPHDNQPNKGRIALGKKLFFDPILSRDSSVSCSSCHLPSMAFSDGQMLSKGVNDLQGIRNSPSLLNIAYHHSFFMDGGVPTLEMQALSPILNPVEMNMTMGELTNRLSQYDDYPELFMLVFGSPPNSYGISRALAAYERTLLSGNSRYDEYLYGNKNALNANETAGMKLFFSDSLACASCHSGVLFTHLGFENNGLYQQYLDSGRARITWDQSDVGKFKVPSLRNISLTAPYMHDGSLNTLDEVVEHYEKGGNGHWNQSQSIKGFYLNEEDKKALIAFLKSLDGRQKFDRGPF